MATPEARKIARSFVAGVVMFALIGLALGLTFKAQTGMPFVPTTTVQAEFKNVHSLSANDQVRQNSKRVGRVSAVEYVDGVAVVTMELDGKRKVYDDARAAIWDESALATKFVELYPGTPEAGPLTGQTIPVGRTKSSTDLYQVLDVFDERTRDAAASTVREAGAGLAGRSEELHDLLASAPNLLDDAGEVSSALASAEADLPGLLRASNELAARFRGRESEIASLVEQSEQTLRAISVDDGLPLTETLNKAPGTLAAVRTALDGLNAPLADTESTMRELAPGAAALGRSERDLRGFLRESVPVAGKVPGVAEQAEPAVEDLSGLIADARPLAPRVTRALHDASIPLAILAPYGPEMGTLFVRGHSFMSQGPAPGIRYARLNANPGLSTVTGGLIESGNYRQNQYPEPGEADGDRMDKGLPSGLPQGGN